MKTLRIIGKFFCLVWFVPAVISCGQQVTDRHIKADITSKAKEDVNFVGVRFIVEDGKVTLWGNCPTPDSRAAVRRKLRTIHVIKSIDDHLLIRPVLIGSSFAKKLQVDSILANYPVVTAELSGDIVMLAGELKQKELEKLLASFEEANITGITFGTLKLRI